MKAPKPTRKLYQTKIRKPTPNEQLTYHTARNHKDLSTYEITCRAQAVYAGIKDLEAEINQMSEKLRTLRIRLSADKAEALGLENVLNSRS